MYSLVWNLRTNHHQSSSFSFTYFVFHLGSFFSFVDLLIKPFSFFFLHSLYIVLFVDFLNGGLNLLSFLFLLSTSNFPFFLYYVHEPASCLLPFLPSRMQVLCSSSPPLSFFFFHSGSPIHPCFFSMPSNPPIVHLSNQPSYAPDTLRPLVQFANTKHQTKNFHVD